MSTILNSVGTFFDFLLVVLGFGSIVFIHELGHFLGMDHVCRSAGETRDFTCSPVGYDPDSIMNPGKVFAA